MIGGSRGLQATESSSFNIGPSGPERPEVDTSAKLHLTTFRIGTPPEPGQGLRVGATRRPPRGVPKERWVADGYFDVWLPALAPSAKLVPELLKKQHGPAAAFEKALDRYERELLSNAESRQTVEFVAQVAARTPVSIGCFCEDESRCHRSRLFKIIQAHAPKA